MSFVKCFWNRPIMFLVCIKCVSEEPDYPQRTSQHWKELQIPTTVHPTSKWLVFMCRSEKGRTLYESCKENSWTWNAWVQGFMAKCKSYENIQVSWNWRAPQTWFVPLCLATPSPPQLPCKLYQILFINSLRKLHAYQMAKMFEGATEKNRRIFNSSTNKSR